MPLPENLRENATVIEIDKNGDDVFLRKGTNEQICLTDDENTEGFSVSCYHKDLKPFMKRGREIKKAGFSFQEIFYKREAEAKAGTLKMPEHPNNLVTLSGKNSQDATLRLVV